MKLTCSHADLNAALRTISRAVGSGKTHPILAGVCMVATDDGELHLTAYDLELGIHATIPAAVDTAGSSVVPYRLLADITSRLSDAISLAVDGARLTLTAAGGSYSLAVAAADDFPALPVVKAAAGASVDLSDALGAVLLACSGDAAKQLLTGVHLAADGAVLRLEATDGHRLATRTMPCGAAALDVVIPARTLQLVRQPITMACDKAHAAITLADGTRIISRILDGTYPNAQALIPATFKATLTADRIALLHAMERVAVIADQHNSIVKLDASAKVLKLSAEAETNSGVESIASDGKLPALAVNAHYLIDGLRSLDGETITINANDSTSPVVLTGEPGQTYLVMPVQIKQ
jgi:DNA polymerase-3 subunit beta